jgi:hypothetical protein
LEFLFIFSYKNLDPVYRFFATLAPHWQPQKLCKKLGGPASCSIYRTASLPHATSDAFDKHHNLEKFGWFSTSPITNGNLH